MSNLDQNFSYNHPNPIKPPFESREHNDFLENLTLQQEAALESLQADRTFYPKKKIIQ